MFATYSILRTSGPRLVTQRFNESLQRFITENVKILKRCKVSLQAGVTFEDGVRNKFSSVEHVIISATLSPNSSSSIDNRNLKIFPYKLNLFTKLVYKQIGAALQSVKQYAALTLE